MKYENVMKRIPGLIQSLNGIKPDYLYEAKFIGEAISYLNMLNDILIEKEKTEAMNSNQSAWMYDVRI